MRDQHWSGYFETRERGSGELVGIANVGALCSTGSALAERTHGLSRMMQTIKACS